MLTFNLEVIKARYEVYSSGYQHSSILRESHFRVKNKSENFSTPYRKWNIILVVRQINSYTVLFIVLVLLLNSVFFYLMPISMR